MMNVCVIIGKVLSKPKLRRMDSEEGKYQILLETCRPFKMSDGSNKKDIFPIILWKGLADELKSEVNVGDIVAIKGRMESECKKIGDNDEFMSSIIAEKMTFIQSKESASQITF